MHDLVSIGDSTIDAFVRLEKAEIEMMKNGEQLLEIPFATKIGIHERVRLMPAGNAHNVAVGSSRLGLDTSFYTVVGDDTNAQIILKNLQRQGVSTTLVQHDRERGTNFHIILSYGAERTILIYHEEYSYSLPKFYTRWAYYSSVARAGAGSLGKQVTDRVKSEGFKLALNPGTYQLELGLKALKPILSVTEALFVNREEAELLLGSKPSTKKLLQGLLKLGPKLAIITDGPKGSYSSDGEQYLYLPIDPRQEAVERTGAGDGYATAFLAARLKGKSLAEAMRWGTFNSGSVLGKIGPQDGLMTRKGLDTYLGANPKLQPKPVRR